MRGLRVAAGTGGGALALDKIDGVVCKVKLTGPAAAVCGLCMAAIAL